MKRHRFLITLKLRGPVLTKSSSPAVLGLDAAVARVACGPDANRPCIHGTLIKGKVREALEQLAHARAIPPVDLGRWFGVDTLPDTGNEPQRGCLHFGDLIAKISPLNHGRRFGIAIESKLGSVKGEMLQGMETPFEAGQEVTFSGHVWCYGGSENDIRQYLRLGLRWLTQVGAERTTGFGRVLDAEVETAPETMTLTEMPPDIAALDFAIHPLGPLCVSNHKIGGNLFESEEFIPGNMIAGALIETAKALDPTGSTWNKVREHIDSLVFRHAFPTPEGGERPPALPLSTVCAGNLIYDVAAFRAPQLLNDETGRWVAPAFPLDWKGSTWAEVENVLGLVHPARELRVRTRIDAEKRMGDKGDRGTGGALFAWEMVHPWTEDCDGHSKKKIVWKGRIELGAVSDVGQRRLVAEQLRELLSQLGYVSKTKAPCFVVVTPGAPLPNVNVGVVEPLALILRTPALLVDPRFQSKAKNKAACGAVDAPEMLALYKDAFDELSCSSLELSHHFAQQFLAGGNHLALRFQYKNKPVYDPWLLTAAGSVFVFTVKNERTATKKVQEWLNAGLPLPDWAKARYTDDWKKNPYIPQNGFGEVAIHRPQFESPQSRPIMSPDPILP